MRRKLTLSEIVRGKLTLSKRVRGKLALSKRVRWKHGSCKRVRWKLTLRERVREKPALNQRVWEKPTLSPNAWDSGCGLAGLGQFGAEGTGQRLFKPKRARLYISKSAEGDHPSLHFRHLGGLSPDMVRMGLRRGAVRCWCGGDLGVWADRARALMNLSSVLWKRMVCSSPASLGNKFFWCVLLDRPFGTLFGHLGSKTWPQIWFVWSCIGDPSRSPWKLAGQ